MSARQGVRGAGRSAGQGRGAPAEGAGAISKETGFTLVELLVVLLIIGVLLAIAVPSFLGASRRAGDVAAKANLEEALVEAHSFFALNDESYAGIDVGTSAASPIGRLDSGLEYLSGPSLYPTRVDQVGLFEEGGTALVLTTWVPGERHCWGIVDLSAAASRPILGVSLPGTYFFRATGPASSCSAARLDADEEPPNGLVVEAGSFPPG